jgi:hypothetical protein
MKRIAFHAGKALILTFILYLLTGFSAFSQLQEPVKWTFKANRINDTIAELQFTAKIDLTWHLYSQDVPPDGPRPTVFTFTKPAGYKLVGKLEEPKPHEEFDDVFEMKVKYFPLQAVFTQKIKIQSNKPVKVSGEVEFQACDRSCRIKNL